jgi:hypothetical protein
MRGRSLAMLGFALCAAGLSPAIADPVHVPYRVTLGVMAVATGVLAVETAHGRYQVSLDGTVMTDMSGARAKAHASGQMTRSRLVPDLYSAGLDFAGQQRRVALAFANGVLAMVAVLPPGPKGSAQTRPKQNESLGLLDPLAALMIPAAPAHLAPLSVCGRTQRVFDGYRRYELTMFPSRSETIRIAGTPVPTLACRASLRLASATPAPARRNNNRLWPELRSGGYQALVWLAAVTGGRLLVPARIEVGLGYGTLVVEATDARAFNAHPLASAP